MLPTDVPQAGDQLVARLDPASRAREGEKGELLVDRHKAQLFNPPQRRPPHAVSDPSTAKLMVAVAVRKHAGSLAPRVAHRHRQDG